MKLTRVDPRRPVPGHLGDRQRPRLRDVPAVRRPRPESRTPSMIVEVDRLRPDVLAPPQLMTTFIRVRRAGRERLRSRCRNRSRSRTTRASARNRGSEGAADTARDCGDFSDACASGFTFFRRDTQVRSTADQLDAAHEWVYIVYDATKPGTEAPTDTTYDTIGAGQGRPGRRSFFLRYDGATGAHTTPTVIDNRRRGHQVFPDISADGGVLHAIWWDSRNDTCYSVRGRSATAPNRRTVPSLDVFGAKSTRSRGRPGPRRTLDHDVTIEPELRAVRQPAGPVRGRLPLGHLARRHRVRRLDGLAEHRRRAPIRGRRRRTRTQRPRTSPVPRHTSRHGQEGQHDQLLERRPLPARGRARPEHLRRQGPVGSTDILECETKGRRTGAPSLSPL